MDIHSLFAFVQEICEKYGIDESHGLKHSMGTVSWAEKLSMKYDDITADENMVIIYSAALHDMCDSKYRNLNEACSEIKTWLLNHNCTEDLASVVINIITTMSYSKLKMAQIDGKPKIYPNHGKWQRAYHIVRHADLLEAYRVVRCYLYSKHRKPVCSEDELWAEIRKIFDERVFKYVSDGWIFLDQALQFVPDLEREALRCFTERDCTYLL